MRLGPLVITKGSLPRVRRYRGACERGCGHEAHLANGSCFGRTHNGLLCGCGALDGLFFEEDEPVEEVVATFDRGEKGLTSPPRQSDANAWEALNTSSWTYNPLTGHMEQTVTTGNSSYVNPLESVCRDQADTILRLKRALRKIHRTTNRQIAENPWDVKALAREALK